MRWVNARKLKLTANFQVKERYRSGHNGADSKSDGRVIPARGFESHPLRQIKKGLSFTPFCIWRCGMAGQPHRVRQNRGAILDDANASVRSEAEDERPSPAASNPTLSATPFPSLFRYLT